MESVLRHRTVKLMFGKRTVAGERWKRNLSRTRIKSNSIHNNDERSYTQFYYWYISLCRRCMCLLHRSRGRNSWKTLFRLHRTKCHADVRKESFATVAPNHQLYFYETKEIPYVASESLETSPCPLRVKLNTSEFCFRLPSKVQSTPPVLVTQMRDWIVCVCWAEQRGVTQTMSLSNISSSRSTVIKSWYWVFRLSPSKAKSITQSIRNAVYLRIVCDAMRSNPMYPLNSMERASYDFTPSYDFLVAQISNCICPKIIKPSWNEIFVVNASFSTFNAVTSLPIIFRRSLSRRCSYC